MQGVRLPRSVNQDPALNPQLNHTFERNAWQPLSYGRKWVDEASPATVSLAERLSIG